MIGRLTKQSVPMTRILHVILIAKIFLNAACLALDFESNPDLLTIGRPTGFVYPNATNMTAMTLYSQPYQINWELLDKIVADLVSRGDSKAAKLGKRSLTEDEIRHKLLVGIGAETNASRPSSTDNSHAQKFATSKSQPDPSEQWH